MPAPTTQTSASVFLRRAGKSGIFAESAQTDCVFIDAVLIWSPPLGSAAGASPRFAQLIVAARADSTLFLRNFRALLPGLGQPDSGRLFSALRFVRTAAT